MNPLSARRPALKIGERSPSKTVRFVQFSFNLAEITAYGERGFIPRGTSRERPRREFLSHPPPLRNWTDFRGVQRPSMGDTGVRDRAAEARRHPFRAKDR